MSVAELIARMETATGPSRELDEAIALAADPESKVALHCIGDDCPVWYRSNAPKIDLPEFTASIDAALTLVPEGWNWLARSPSDNSIRYKSKFFAHIDRLPADQGDELAYAETAAIALCIAALKARLP